MKILLVTEYFYPLSNGGTELYVYNLAKALQEKQHYVEILSVSDHEQKCIVYKDITVYYIPFNHDFDTAVISGNKPADNLGAFTATVQNTTPDIVHFHTLTTSISTYHIEAVKQQGFKTILTSHIAAHTCIRGSLMQLGKFVCDGKVEKQKCLSCYLQKYDMPEPLNQLLALVIKKAEIPYNLSKIVDYKQTELTRLKINLDQLVVVSNWQKEVFSRNNFNKYKITLCRQAVEYCKIQTSEKVKNHKLIIGFIGRISKIKGLHILLAALRKIHPESFEIKIAAIQIPEESDYYLQQKKQVENMPGSFWIEDLPNNQVNDFMQSLDVLCVPSQVFETGPFVVYEALAQSIPVIGSNLGGIKELIIEGKNGWLFPHQDYKYLQYLIASFIVQKNQNGTLLKNIEPITRSTEKLAEEMLTVYQNLNTDTTQVES